MRVFADGKELDPSRWSLNALGHLNLHGEFPYGTTISIQPDDEWKFGDILCFGGGNGRLMFLCDRDDGTANMLVLDDPTPSRYAPGLIRNFHPSTLKKVNA